MISGRKNLKEYIAEPDDLLYLLPDNIFYQNYKV